MNPSIALGFGDNIDYEIIWDSRILEDLIRQYTITKNELDIHRFIKTERDLVISILAFLKYGSGGERIVFSSDILETFAEKFDKQITLGGTSVRAAIAMQIFNCKAALHLVTINDHVRSRLPPDCPYVCSQTKDSLHPHLIIQFDKGTTVKAGDIEICSSQANRIIYHKDDDNISMALNEDFAALLSDAKILLVSGFNAMQSKNLLDNRLQTLQRIILSLPEDALLFYEDAGYDQPEFRQTVLSALLQRKLIISLNEDELGEYVTKKLDLLNVDQIIEALKSLKSQVPKALIVVHTQFWALVYGQDASTFANALKGGMTMATARYCFGDGFSLKNYQDIANLPALAKAAHFSEAIHHKLSDVFCLPVAEVNPAKATTIGLGDAFVGGFIAAYP
ncbi:MAG: hypothetical protein KC422_12655 [Trueperaceae bacterium]|nr:hypothetical protein [Trueperaceae bacterium]